MLRIIRSSIALYFLLSVASVYSKNFKTIAPWWNKGKDTLYIKSSWTTLLGMALCMSSNDCSVVSCLNLSISTFSTGSSQSCDEFSTCTKMVWWSHNNDLTCFPPCSDSTTLLFFFFLFLASRCPFSMDASSSALFLLFRLTSSSASVLFCMVSSWSLIFDHYSSQGKMDDLLSMKLWGWAKTVLFDSLSRLFVGPHTAEFLEGPARPRLCLTLGKAP